MAMSFQVSSRTVWRVGLNVMALLLLWRALGRLGLVLTLVVLALFVALALDAPVRWLQARGLGRGWAVLVVMVALCGVLALMVRTLIPMLVDQAHLLGRTAPGLAERLSQWEWLREMDARYGLQATLVRTLQGLPGMLAGSVVGVLSTTLLGVAAGLTVLVLVLFMLLFGGALVQDAVGSLEAGRRARAVRPARPPDAVHP
jgi:predicted PurR-regulated permease PerM